MKTRGDKPWEVIFAPEDDEILVCAELRREVLAEGLAMPYDSPVLIQSLRQARQHTGTWRVELWAPSARAARVVVREQMRKRRAAVALGAQ